MEWHQRQMFRFCLAARFIRWMAAKNTIKVLIDGKIVTLSGYESEEYLQKIALYINNKMSELNELPGYKRMGSDMQKTLLELNMADDYYKARKRIGELETDLEDKDKAEYDLKHELIAAQIQLDESSRKVDQLKDEINELQKQIVKAKADQQKD